MTQAYPLQWPRGKKRKTFWQRKDSKFDKKMTIRKAVDRVISEVRRFEGNNVVISSNLHLRQDGLPMSKQRQPDDPGVAIYFSKQREQYCFSCDEWQRVQDNIWAIYLSIDALRGLARWGGSDYTNAAFAGFKRLGNGQPHWTTFIDTDIFDTVDKIEKQFKVMLHREHPDRDGGNKQAFQSITVARNDFRADPNW